MKKTTTLACLLLALLSAGMIISAAAQVKNPHAPDTPEPGSVEAIAKFTTEARFVSPWVAYVPASDTVPSPTKYLGHVVGAAGELSSTAKIYGYFRKLAEASPRVRVQTIGRSEEGREILLVAISDEEGIRDLARLKAATAALADARKTTPDQAETIIASARPIYYFNAGLHSTETGSPEMVMELAYRLAVSEQPMIKRIRSEVIVLINPVSEPDGRDKDVDWFYRYLKGKTDFDSLPPMSPPYWGHYVFHDNNRDTHQQALELTRAVTRMFFDFHPTVIHDLHESIPLLQTWNGTGPYNNNLDPILINEFFEMAFAEIGALTSMGMPGVWTWGFGEGWTHHYLDSFAVNHNSMGRGYETFGNATAETVERVLRPNEERYVGRPVTSREWYRPMPPPRKFSWSLRDNTNYMETGCLAILDYAAKNAKEMLRDFYRKGYNSWQKGVKGSPFAFAVREDQGDRRRVAEMLRFLMTHGIEISRAAAPFKVDEGEFAAGTYIVKLDQPYRNYAVDLLLPQEFPPDTPYEPYDDVSWSVPVHYGLEAKRIDDAKIKDVPVTALQASFEVQGKVNGAGPVYLLKDTGQEALLALRSRLSAFKVEIAERAFKSGSAEYPAGSWIVSDQKGLAEAMKRAAAELAVDFESASAVPDVARHESKLPRLAVWHTWADTESTGWVRYVLDREKVPYSYIRDDDIRAGRLHERYDIVIFPHNYLGLQDQIQGIDRKWAPMAYTKTKEYPSHGVPDASEDITGGIGWGGMANLEKYLADGGLLITLGNGSTLPLDGGLVRDVYRKPGAFFTPGSELKVKFVRPDHPLAYGFPEVTSAFRTVMPVYDIAVAGRSGVVLQWGTKLRSEDREEPGTEGGKAKDAKEQAKKEEIKMLVSGAVKGDDELEGRPAILDLPAGRGRVIAYNFEPIHRDLNRSDYRFLWNALLNWNALPPAGSPPGTADTKPFVTVRDGKFVLSGLPYHFVGANFWQGMNLGVSGPSGDRTRLVQELDNLRQLGVTNLRVMASSEGPNTEPHRMVPALMTSPGVYDESVLDGLDFLLAEMGKRGMRAVMVLNNFWEWSGGMAQYVSWHEKAKIPYPGDYEVFIRYSAKFYSYAECQTWFRNHIAMLTSRTNPYTGLKYRDDPAVFSWELANEPRHYPQSWIDETAAYIKSLDSHHMVTTGSEGGLPGDTQDFVKTHRGRDIDYVTIHIWPQNWDWFDPQKPATYQSAEVKAVAYFQKHAKEAASMRKPLVLEEFGLARDWAPLHDNFNPGSPTTLRDLFYAALYQQVLASISTGGAAAGDNFWAWGGGARPGNPWIGDPPHETPGWYSVYDVDASTLAIIAAHAKKMAER